MDSPSVNFKSNQNVIVGFNSIDKFALVESNRRGELSVNECEKSYIGNATYIYSHDINKTLSIVSDTCIQTVEELSSALNSIDHSNSQTDLSQKLTAATSVLSGINKIRNNFLLKYSPEDINFKNFSEVVSKLEEKISEAQRLFLLSSKIDISASSVFDNDFEIPHFDPLHKDEPLPMHNNSYALDGVSSRWSTPGEGPTSLGKMTAGVNTVKNWIQGKFFQPFNYEPSQNRVTLDAQKRVANPASQLRGSDVSNFITNLKDLRDLNLVHVHEFYATNNSNINEKSFSEIKSIIDGYADAFLHRNNLDKSIPIVIPISFSNQGYWEINHIALIMVHNDVLEYYDSKGVESSHKLLNDGSGSLKNVIDYCCEKFGAHHVIENRSTQQFDINNCGVFVCKHLHDRLVGGLSVGDQRNEVNVVNFRQTILDVAFPKEKTDLPKPASLMEDGEDFEM